MEFCRHQQHSDIEKGDGFSYSSNFQKLPNSNSIPWKTWFRWHYYVFVCAACQSKVYIRTTSKIIFTNLCNLAIFGGFTPVSIYGRTLDLFSMATNIIWTTRKTIWINKFVNPPCAVISIIIVTNKIWTMFAFGVPIDKTQSVTNWCINSRNTVLATSNSPCKDSSQNKPKLNRN